MSLILRVRVFMCVRGNVFIWCEPQWRRLHATVDAAVRWAPGLCELLNKSHQREFSHFQIQEPQLSDTPSTQAEVGKLS